MSDWHLVSGIGNAISACIILRMRVWKCVPTHFPLKKQCWGLTDNLISVQDYLHSQTHQVENHLSSPLHPLSLQELSSLHPKNLCFPWTTTVFVSPNIFIYLFKTLVFLFSPWYVPDSVTGVLQMPIFHFREVVPALKVSTVFKRVPTEVVTIQDAAWRDRWVHGRKPLTEPWRPLCQGTTLLNDPVVSHYCINHTS